MDEALRWRRITSAFAFHAARRFMTGARTIPDPARARPLFERAASGLSAGVRSSSSHLDQLGDHPKGELADGAGRHYYRLARRTKRGAILRSW